MSRPNVLITGASGLVGRSLTERLPQEGFTPVPLRRRAEGDASAPAGPWWAPPTGEVELGELPYRSVIHLAGAGVADRPWTEKRKRILRESRVDATASLVEALLDLPPDRRPESLVCASAIGIYGDRGDELLTEESPPGCGFLANLARDWEAAAAPAREAGIRVAHLRLGVVLSPSGGALKAMLPIFRFGLGGPLGNGRQYLSWISLHDAVAAFLTLVTREDARGPINGVSPGAVPQRVFARELGRAIRRPAFIPTPGLALRLALGDMAREMLLASLRVEPKGLYALDFRFRHPDLRTALPAVGVV